MEAGACCVVDEVEVEAEDEEDGEEVDERLCCVLCRGC